MPRKPWSKTKVMANSPSWVGAHYGRDPAAKSLQEGQFQQRVVAPKKGRGSYRRKKMSISVDKPDHDG